MEPLVLLIGINFYPGGDHTTGSNDDRIFIENLVACVPDMRNMEDYFLNTLNITKTRVKVLTSTQPNSSPPIEPEEKECHRATGINIREALNDILIEGKPDTPVYIHYSGHGARVKTCRPDLKGENGLDECLVPCDVESTGDIIRDLEIGTLLHKMHQQGLRVTLVLDCCFSGGADRDDEEQEVNEGIMRYRGLDDGLIDAKISQMNAGFQYRDVSKPSFPELHGPALHKGLKKSDPILSWWNQKINYEFMAACQAHQKAAEKNGTGLLSRHLLKALMNANMDLQKNEFPSHGSLYDRIRSSMAFEKPNQIPVFAGNRNRCILSNQLTKHVKCIRVTVEDFYGRPYAYIEAGKAHSVVKKTKFLVYQWSTIEFVQKKAIAVVVVKDVEETRSLVELLDEKNQTNKSFINDAKEAGYLAVEYQLPDENYVRIKWDSKMNKPTDFDTNAARNNCKFVVDGQQPNYHIQVNRMGDNKLKYILTNKDNLSIPNLPPFSGSETLYFGIKKLERYRKIKDLESGNGALDFEFGITPIGLTNEDETPDLIRIADKGRFNFHFRNNTDSALYVVILNLRPLYGIKQVYPNPKKYQCGTSGEKGEYMSPELDKITASDVKDAKEPIDIYKCIVATDHLEYQHMQQENITDDVEKCREEGEWGVDLDRDDKKQMEWAAKSARVEIIRAKQ